MRTSLLGLLVTIVTLPGLCFGQTALSSPRHTPTPHPEAVEPAPAEELSPAVARIAELKRLQINLAETAFQIDPNLENRALLLDAYEKLAATVCFQHLLEDLAQDPAPTSAECTELTNKIFALQAKNPIATCIRDGIDSRSCQQIFANQTIESANLESETRALDDAGIAAAREATAASIESARNTFAASAKAPADILALRRSYDMVLRVICSKSALRLVPAAASPVTKNPLADLGFGSAASETPATEAGAPAAANFDRIRLIGTECLSRLDDLDRVDADSPLSICYRQGFVTPQCVAAKRRERQMLRGIQPGTGSRSVGAGGGFSTF